MKKLILVLAVFVALNSGAVVIQGETTPGVYTNVAVDSSGIVSTSSTITFPAQNSTTSGQTGALVQGATTTSAPTYTTAKTNPLSLTTAGALRVDGSGVTQPVSGTITAVTAITNALPAGTNSIGTVVNLPTASTLTDCSGSITSGGTAQSLVASNSTRKYLFIQNSSDTTMWINFTTTAVANQPSIQLTAGSSFVMEGMFVSTEAVSTIGATTGKVYTCKQS